MYNVPFSKTMHLYSGSDFYGSIALKDIHGETYLISEGDEITVFVNKENKTTEDETIQVTITSADEVMDEYPFILKKEDTSALDGGCFLYAYIHFADGEDQLLVPKTPLKVHIPYGVMSYYENKNRIIAQIPRVMGRNGNYYRDSEGVVHYDIPLGTSPVEAYARTNLNLNNKTAEINQHISEICDNINTRVSSEITAVSSRVDNIVAHSNDTEGNTELIDIRTGTDGTVFSAAGSAVRNQFMRHEGMFGELMDYAYLSTKTTVTHNEQYEGSIIRSDGVVTSNQYTTRFVVKKYENVPVGKYSAHGYPQGSNCLYAVIGSDQTVLEYQKVGDTLTADIRDCDFYVAYEGCTVYVGGYETIEPMLYKYDKTLSLKDSLYVPQIESNNNTLNPLYNKIVTLNGDSIAYGAGCSVGGVNYGFMDFIADRNSMTLDKQAVSGGCLSVKNSESAGRHYICRTIDNMEQNADYVIFEGGYNDYYLWHKVGSITETMTDEVDDTTVYGALESICRQALEKWKTAKIGFIITHKVNVAWRTVHANSSTERVTLEDYYQAIRDVCEKYSIPYLDLSKVSRLNTELESYKTFTYNSDGIHPTQTGYETFYVPLIENWMKNL